MAFATSAFLDPFPQKVEFEGSLLSNRENNNDSLNKEISIYSYRNSNNTKKLTIASTNESDVSIKDFRERYINNFKSQGVHFKQEGSHYLGSKANTILYLVENYTLGALLIYSEKIQSTKQPLRPNANTFLALETLEF